MAVIPQSCSAGDARHRNAAACSKESRRACERCRRFPGDHILRQRTPRVAKDFIAGFEARNSGAHRLDGTGEIGSQPSRLGRDASEEWMM